MPCRSDYMDDGESTALRNELDTTTQKLCWALGTLEGNGLGHLIKNAKQIHEWWTHHQNADEMRVYQNMTGHVKNKVPLQILQANDPKAKAMLIDSLAHHFILEAEKAHPVSSFHKLWFVKMATKVTDDLITDAKKKQHAEEMRKIAMQKIKGALSPEELSAIGMKP